ASRALRVQPRSGHRKRFLAVCCVMVLAPSLRLPRLLTSTADRIAFKSNPQCSKKRWSSDAITASARRGEILSSGVQDFRSAGSRPPRHCSYALIPIRGVMGGGTNLNRSTAAQELSRKPRTSRRNHRKGLFQAGPESEERRALAAALGRFLGFRDRVMGSGQI